MNQRVVLTVEDDAAIRRGIVDALEYAGYEVLQAATGDRGLEMAVQQSYDLLLLDLVLPEKTGLEILRQPSVDLRFFEAGRPDPRILDIVEQPRTVLEKQLRQFLLIGRIGCM